MGRLVAAQHPIPAQLTVPCEISSPAPIRYLGRQPILDGKLNLHGYELLYRGGLDNSFSGDPEEATRQVADNYLMMVPEATRSIAFVNCTRHALVSGMVTLLPAHNTVLEILEFVEADDELLESCASLRKLGYRFALDDFLPLPSKIPFLQFADYIKIDFRASGPEERQQIYTMATSCGAMLIAEKVETTADMECARSEGCHLFQGYFFSKPIIIAQRAISRNHLTYLRLLAALCRERIDVNEIEMLVKSELSLCYALLRLVNSALYSLPTRVNSVRSALVLVGADELSKLVTVALASVFAEKNSRTLVSMALERAKFCERLAPLLSEPPSKLYLLGMLSLLDAIVQVPMAQILKSLPLEPEMVAALTGGPSKLSVALDLVRCFECGNWKCCDSLHNVLGLNETRASALYMESIQWADQAMNLSQQAA